MRPYRRRRTCPAVPKFPRSDDRGPIEAGNLRPLVRLAVAFPRSDDRGPIEARADLVVDKWSSLARKIESVRLYGGLLVENLVQAVSRDILAHAMQALESHGFPVVMHVHDEVVCEVAAGAESIEDFRRVFSSPPDWAAGLPLKVEVWSADRYEK